jgi:hypothetical protein
MVGLVGLHPCGGKSAVEELVELVEGALPLVVPALPAAAGGVQGEGGQVEALEGGLLVGEVAAGGGRAAVAGVEGLDGYLEL